MENRNFIANHHFTLRSFTNNVYRADSYVRISIFTRDAPNMLKNLPIIPSRTSQNLSLLFFKIPPIIPKLFRSDSKKITAIAN